MHGLRIVTAVLLAATVVSDTVTQQESVLAEKATTSAVNSVRVGVVNEDDLLEVQDELSEDSYQLHESMSPAPLVITASAVASTFPQDRISSPDGLAPTANISLVSSASVTTSENDTGVQHSLSLPTMVIPSTLGSSAGASNFSDDNEDDSVFLSFEEWKKQNLELSGQSTENLDDRTVHRSPVEQNQLNIIGDDNEIDIGMFQPQHSGEEDDTRSGKVYKERFNFASFDCAATIVKTNTGTKGASNILFENKDTYLINECSEPNKFLIIELCQDILVETVKIANFEFFSSMFRHIRISITDAFPSSSWRVVGEFEAKSVRDFQTFSIKNPQIWARFLRIEILSHYGNEFYCPISVVQVHGTTMMDQYRSHEQSAHHIEDNRNMRAVGSIASQAVMALSNASDTIKNGPTPEISPEKMQQSFELSNSLDLRVPEVPTSIFGSRPGESSVAECPVPAEKIEEQEWYQENMSLPVVTQLISPLVFNESCNWDEYMHFSTINSTFSLLNKTGTENGEFKTQDSIYQTIMKRLSLLESNATLSLRYIEDQSQNMRELLHKIEKKQTNRIDVFFSEFNSTVFSQFHTFQEQYSKLLLNTMIESQTNQQRVNQDIEAMSYRLKLLADELVYQKNMGIIQAIVLVTILLFVITTRGAPIDSYANGNSTFARLWGVSSMTSSVVGSPRSVWARSRSSSPVHSGDDQLLLGGSNFVSKKNLNQVSSEDEENDRYDSYDDNDTTNHIDFGTYEYNDNDSEYDTVHAHNRSKSVEISRTRVDVSPLLH
jgi:hypothetical protein